MTLNIYCQKLIQKKFPIPEKLYIHVHIYSMGTDGVNKYIVPNNNIAMAAHGIYPQ